MNSPEAGTLLLVDHTEIAPFVFDELRAGGFKVALISSNPRLLSMADVPFHRNSAETAADCAMKHAREIRELGLSGVTTFVEHAKVAEVEVKQALGFRIESVEGRFLGRDKLGMKRALSTAGISTPEFEFIPDSEELSVPGLEFPFIVKPNLGFASGGVHLVRTPTDFLEACRTIRRMNRIFFSNPGGPASGIICEQFIEGPEFSVDAISVNGKTRLFCVCGRKFPAEGGFQDYLYFTPPSGMADELKELSQLIPDAMEALGHRNGPSHTELRFDLRTRRWHVLETAFRVGAGGNIGLLIRALTNFPYNANAAKASLGIPFEIEASHPPSSAGGMSGFVYFPGTGAGGRVKRMLGGEFLEREPGVVYGCLAKNAGDRVISHPRGIDYIGVVVATALNAAEMEKLADRVCEEVRVEYE